jgi:hypothetical protein
MSGAMQPLARIPPGALRAVRIVLCDIDDTLTHAGRLPAVAFAALELLHDAGLRVMPVTGRPAGWCDHIARLWPVDGIVGENGALAFRYDPAARRMLRLYAREAGQRAADRAALARIAERILVEVEGAAIAADQAWRDSDLAIDFCEDVAPLAPAQVERIASIFEAEGATAKVSSIHVNGWFGDHDKLTMTRRLLRQAFAADIDTHPELVAFVGDSPNDAPMFAHFPVSVGVANVRAFAGRLEAEPKWVTEREGGYGFAEFADRVLKAHGSRS